MKKALYAAFAALLLLAACDDTTGAAGAEVMPQADDVVTSTAIFNAPTRTVAADHVLINTPHTYLGCIVDPETDALTRSSFLAQYQVMDNFTMPAQSLMVTDADGLVACDSCELRLYFSSYYGDSLTTMNVRVRELDRAKVMEEGQHYYSDINPSDYVAASPRVDRTISYSIYDPTNTTSVSLGSAYYRSIRLRFPAAYGAEILRTYYAHPEYFASSYQFIRNVCPGFYVENVGGVGSLLDVEFSTLDIYYRYHATTSAGTDTTYVGMARVAATEEVLQNTSVTTQIPDGLLAESNPYTLLKSPAGAYTEMTIPVDDILGGEHATDSLNSAQLILDRYNGDEAITSPFALEAPANVLMLPKADLYTFFEQSYLPDNITSFMAQYSNGAYAFNNIALLVTTLQARRDQGAGITPADTEAQRAAKAATYAEANPDTPQ